MEDQENSAHMGTIFYSRTCIGFVVHHRITHHEIHTESPDRLHTASGDRPHYQESHPGFHLETHRSGIYLAHNLPYGQGASNKHIKTAMRCWSSSGSPIFIIIVTRIS